MGGGFSGVVLIAFAFTDGLFGVIGHNFRLMTVAAESGSMNGYSVDYGWWVI